MCHRKGQKDRQWICDNEGKFPRYSPAAPFCISSLIFPPFPFPLSPFPLSPFLHFSFNCYAYLCNRSIKVQARKWHINPESMFFPLLIKHHNFFAFNHRIIFLYLTYNNNLHTPSYLLLFRLIYFPWTIVSLLSLFPNGHLCLSHSASPSTHRLSQVQCAPAVCPPRGVGGRGGPALSPTRRLRTHRRPQDRPGGPPHTRRMDSGDVGEVMGVGVDET